MAAKKRRTRGLRGLSGTPKQHADMAESALIGARQELRAARDAKTCKQRIRNAAKAYAAASEAESESLSMEAGAASKTIYRSAGKVSADAFRLLLDSTCVKSVTLR